MSWADEESNPRALAIPILRTPWSDRCALAAQISQCVFCRIRMKFSTILVQSSRPPHDPFRCVASLGFSATKGDNLVLPKLLRICAVGLETKVAPGIEPKSTRHSDSEGDLFHRCAMAVAISDCVFTPNRCLGSTRIRTQKRSPLRCFWAILVDRSCCHFCGHVVGARHKLLTMCLPRGLWQISVFDRGILHFGLARV